MRAALPRPTDVFDGTFECQTVRQVIEWKSPARSDNVLEISTWVSRIGTTSFVLNCEMRRAGETDVLATTETTYVHVDPKTFTKRAIEPAHARRAGGRRPRQDHRPRRLSAVIVIAACPRDPALSGGMLCGRRRQRSGRFVARWIPGMKPRDDSLAARSCNDRGS